MLIFAQHLYPLLIFFQYRALAEAEANDSERESFTDAVEWTRYMVTKYYSWTQTVLPDLVFFRHLATF